MDYFRMKFARFVPLVIIVILLGCGSAPSRKGDAMKNGHLSQSELAHLAVEGSDLQVRVNAIKQLSDQTILARLALEDKDEYVRSAAISNRYFKDETLLTNIADKDSSDVVRDAIWLKLTDKTVLCKHVFKGKVVETETGNQFVMITTCTVADISSRAGMATLICPYLIIDDKPYTKDVRCTDIPRW